MDAMKKAVENGCVVIRSIFDRIRKYVVFIPPTGMYKYKNRVYKQ